MAIRLVALQEQRALWIAKKQKNLGRASLGIVEDETDFLELTLVIAGDGTVGKSNLFSRFAGKGFQDKYAATPGVDYFRKDIRIADQNYKLKIWDLAGASNYSHIIDTYYKFAKVVLCVYDITNKKSFENIQQLIKRQRENLDENVRFILVGNKCDLEQQRQVSKEEAAKVASKLAIPFLEVSALTNHNVNKILTIALNPINFQNPGNDPFSLGNSNSPAFKKILETAYNTAFLAYNRIVSRRCCFFTAKTRFVQLQKLQDIIQSADCYDSFIKQTLKLKDEIHQDHLDNSYFAKKGYTDSALESAIHNMLITMAAQDDNFRKRLTALTDARLMAQIEQVMRPK